MPSDWEYNWATLFLGDINTGPKRVAVSLLLPEDGNRSSFRNVVLSCYLQFRRMDEAHEVSGYEINFLFMLSNLSNLRNCVVRSLHKRLLVTPMAPRWPTC
jgi:hypothetical protein